MKFNENSFSTFSPSIKVGRILLKKSLRRVAKIKMSLPFSLKVYRQVLISTFGRDLHNQKSAVLYVSAWEKKTRAARCVCILLAELVLANTSRAGRQALTWAYFAGHLSRKKNEMKRERERQSLERFLALRVL